jgi:cytochrome b pre-mRNA-processing protein 3
MPWRRKDAQAAEIYGAIVARSRLPVFYQVFGVPDTLQGRFVVLSLHLFAVLHRLRDEGPLGVALAQHLTNRFAADMDTVLRELGVGDLSVPKKVRTLAASGASLIEDYERALAGSADELRAAIARTLPLDEGAADAASVYLTPYVLAMVSDLEQTQLQELGTGTLIFPAP